jgi:hypothetical protein
MSCNKGISRKESIDILNCISKIRISEYLGKLNIESLRDFTTKVWWWLKGDFPFILRGVGSCKINSVSMEG